MFQLEYPDGRASKLMGGDKLFAGARLVAFSQRDGVKAYETASIDRRLHEASHAARMSKACLKDALMPDWLKGIDVFRVATSSAQYVIVRPGGYKIVNRSTEVNWHGQPMPGQTINGDPIEDAVIAVMDNGPITRTVALFFYVPGVKEEANGSQDAPQADVPPAEAAPVAAAQGDGFLFEENAEPSAGERKGKKRN